MAIWDEEMYESLKEAYSSINNSVKIMAKTMSSISESPALQALGELAKQYTDAYKKYASAISEIRLEIPKINISPELLSSIEGLRYLYLYQRADWPLFLVDNDSLREFTKPFLEEEIPEHSEFTSAVLSYFDQFGIDAITSQWTSFNSINKDRIPIITEAARMYEEGSYISCVSICACQLEGIISDSYQMLAENGASFDINNVELIYQHFNPDKELDSQVSKRIETGEGRLSEKYKLICMLSDIDTAVFYWNAAISYLYGIVLTSDEEMESSQHPCRNKICHGVQLNYNTHEHALKAILSMDIALKLAEMNYKSKVG